MGKHVRGREALAPSEQSVPVPTVGQVLVRALPAAIMMLAGFPLLAWWWLVNEDSSFWAVMAVLGGNIFLGSGILRISQAPRSRLGKKADRESLQRTIASTAEKGVPPADPSQRAAAGALACEIVEWSLLRVAAAVGFVLTIFVTGVLFWGVLAAAFTFNAMVDARRTRRSWHYLKAIHAAPRTI